MDGTHATRFFGMGEFGAGRPGSRRREDSKRRIRTMRPRARTTTKSSASPRSSMRRAPTRRSPPPPCRLRCRRRWRARRSIRSACTSCRQAAGEYLARQLKCEAAMVTAGAASALTLATAAAMTLGNRTAMHSIPTDVTGLEERSHRAEGAIATNTITRSAIAAREFVEVVTLAEYEAAFTDRTVMTNFFNAAEAGRDQPRGLDPRGA